ncbi:MAG: acyl-CoA dehydratase activase [Candidatus Omnitrophica bacterium]|nr:acyl-CoA dehydratase activase [Candidatus Omnitrophota bacterium]
MKAGIDIGSVMTKCVIVEGNRVIAKTISRSGPMPEKIAENILQQALKNAGIEFSQLEKIVSTGYGRHIFSLNHKTVTEVSAAAKASFYLSGEKPCLVIDVGGQDTKTIEVDRRGEVVDFLMNDKCAAGTGRFLEMMATVLETDIYGLGKLALSATKPVVINSTCSVFAESEVVSLLAHNEKKENIAAGLLNAIAARIATMMSHFRKDVPVVFCGGGANIPGLKESIEKISGRQIHILENPQFVVAFGAAIS